MVLLPEVFKPEEVAPSGFEIIPAGWYEAEITRTELKKTNEGTGKYIAITFKILDGDYDGRLVWVNLNIINKSDVAVKIARSDLKSICVACGRDEDEELEDTVDWHNIPMAIKLSIQPETAQWPEKNEIKGYKSLDESPL